MIFRWFRDRRRRKLLAAPFPKAWEAILRRNVAHYARLDAGERARLRDLVRVFVAEKSWEGCGGLRLTDEMRVTIAAQACLLALALPGDLYPNVASIFVYPSSVRLPARRIGVFEAPPSLPVEDGMPIDGEAMPGGPTILVWDEAKRSARHPESGHNVVYHEFAHQLDMLDGPADGTPPLEGAAARKRWVAALEPEFLRLREQAARDEPTFIDAYGATNEAEFFAVVTEHFFDEPLEMRELHPKLYAALKEFYRQDPAEREEARIALQGG